MLMWIFGFLTIGTLAAFLMLRHGSPGPLSVSHARVIKGTFIKSCKQCHTDQGLTQGCLNCHDEIARQVDQDRGYHAYLLRDESHTCQRCHPEHHGEEFPLVSDLAWQGQDPNMFNHPHVVFKLSGQHVRLACADCHHAKRKGPFTLSAFPLHHRSTTYLGLDQACISCHQDIHAGGRVRACDVCHDQDAFVPAPYFQHDDYFALEGAHTQTPCSACHLPDAQESQVKATGADPNDMSRSFQHVKGKLCSQCHASPHRTPWDQGCQTCHHATDLNWSQGQRGIDLQVHAELGFALEGAHSSLACASCHAPDQPYAERYIDSSSPDYARQPGHCEGCHQNPHGDQFREGYTSCRDCHTQSHFRPSTIDPVWHAQLFPLTEAHTELACVKCHPTDAHTGMQRFVDTPNACRACHQDPHQGQFQDRYESCLDCHDPNHFTPSTFSLTQHAHYFALTGAHAQLTCDQCHPADPNLIPRRFVGTSRDCQGCHSDPHGGQFQDRYTSCLDCHHSDRFVPTTLGPAQHSETYPLAGAHRAVACIQCHRVDANTKVRQFRSTPKTCNACHLDPHRGQFQQDGQTQCERCHGSTDLWAAEEFVHERDTQFPLEGSHAKVTCQACHPAIPQKNGQSVIQYRPTSTRCEDCHGYISK